MSVDRMVMAFAGLVVLLSVALSHFVHPAWMWLTVFVGANLLQASVTGFCPAAMIFKAFGAKPGACFK
ncbi:DUF2892 domain-containing protein [Asticcacaulis sp. AND118]|uniref:YgaP family membrane protein n=1 Tax=Asticcacaulis sp. AND118 TaxID=2840468 RepID=UPI001D000A93|nr:DUF2892 domain-containing protein [Asticcacaulis sp. AND118]UDF05786.1 DUF2892 domain-containing protein [Asticcacaulis sp. AND118]